PKAGQDSGQRTDDEGEDGFDERDPQMLPDRTLDEPFDDARGDVDRGREEEWRQKLHAADRHAGEELPQQHRNARNEKLEHTERKSRHDKIIQVAIHDGEKSSLAGYTIQSILL